MIAPTTASWETCNDIQSWLRTCEIEHDKCIDRRQRQEWRFPTRLLYVGILEGGNILRLCESRLLSAHPKYATLSHCWGGVVIGKLTSAVYSSYKNGFSIAGLPRNFRDAITLTRSLGIEYLWIDSLCIIQDSATDWETECELMSDVYGGSFVNIAASASSNANGGIFDNRDLRRVTPFKTQLAFKSNSQLKGTFAFLPRTCDFGDLEQTPLSKRAWTVQERLLAPRTLHFLSHKVVWECSSLQASESDVTGKLDRRSKSGLQDWALPSSGNCLSKWDTAVQMYTRGELTLPSDKLIAISGVAKFIKNMWQNNSVRYLAGLWSYQIESSLAWRTFKGTPLVNDEYRAPTWSWASVDGPVSPNVLWEESNVLPTRVLHAYTEPISDPFGAVKGGFIKVSGPLCHVQSRSSDEEPCSEEFPLLLASTGHRLRFRELHFDNRGPRDNHTVSEQKYALAGLSKLFTTATPMEGVLLQTTGRKPGQYIRIGYFLIENWGRPIEDKEDTFECLQCHHEQDADLSDSYPRNDYERIEEAFEEMDLPPSMYEQKDEATSAYIYEII